MTLRILHLSGLHFKTTGNDPVAFFNADVVIKRMIEKIAEIVHNNAGFDLIIITGDLAFSGIEEEYKVADAFCRKLLTVTGLTNNRLFVVPGNHDIDRSKVKNLHRIS